MNAADPVVDGDRMFLSSGYGKGCALFKLASRQPTEVWKSKVLRAQMNAPVLWKGHLYGVDGDTTDRASLKCIELETGAEKWAVAIAPLVLLAVRGRKRVAARVSAPATA